MSEEFKGYVASREHRFEISRDPISQQRYEATRQLPQDIQKLPFYRELILKGSLAKGKVLTEPLAETTDVDLGCVIDVQAVLDVSTDSITDMCREQGIDPSGFDIGPVTPQEAKVNLFASADLSPESIVQLRAARKVTEQFAKHALQRRLVNMGVAIPPRVEPFAHFIDMNGPFSIASTLAQYETTHTGDRSQHDWNLRVGSTWSLALPFGMAIGNGLAPYRNVFFNQLQALPPEVAEQKWQLVRKALIGNERPGVLPPAIEAEYPRTLQEAMRMYMT